MNEGFILAFFAIIVGIPVVAGVGGDMFKRWLKHKETTQRLLVEQTAEKAARYAVHAEQLEERVRVLERIVTDGSYETARQIEHLRDKPLN